MEWGSRRIRNSTTLESWSRQVEFKGLKCLGKTATNKG